MATTKIRGSKGGLAGQQSSRYGQVDKLAGNLGGLAGKNVQIGEIVMVDGTDSVWGGSVEGGGWSEEREVGRSWVEAYIVRDNMVSRKIMCILELYNPCSNWDCISEGIISRWAGGREANWRRS